VIAHFVAKPVVHALETIQIEKIAAMPVAITACTFDGLTDTVVE
jgi:hypothetical protein